MFPASSHVEQGLILGITYFCQRLVSHVRPPGWLSNALPRSTHQFRAVHRCLASRIHPSAWIGADVQNLLPSGQVPWAPPAGGSPVRTSLAGSQCAKGPPRSASSQCPTPGCALWLGGERSPEGPSWMALVAHILTFESVGELARGRGRETGLHTFSTRPAARFPGAEKNRRSALPPMNWPRPRPRSEVKRHDPTSRGTGQRHVRQPAWPCTLARGCRITIGFRSCAWIRTCESTPGAHERNLTPTRLSRSSTRTSTCEGSRVRHRNIAT